MDGDGKPDKEGEEDQGSVTGGGSCDVAPVCKGDPQECAIIQQAWETRCAIEKLTDSGGEDMPAGLLDYAGTAGEALAEHGLFSEFDISEGWELPDLGGSPGSCPGPVDVNIPFLSKTVQFPYDFLCSFLDIVRPVFLAVMLFFAGRFVIQEI
jgi:hypothetical protein